MLCERCQTIDFYPAHNDYDGFTHHSTFRDLAQAADNGCELCMLIKSQADSKLPDLVERIQWQNCPVICGLPHTYSYGGPRDEYRGCRTLIFYQLGKGKLSRSLCTLGVAADEGEGQLFLLNDEMLTGTDSVVAGSKIISGRRLQATANSETCFDMTERWIANCLKEHPDSCPHDAKSCMPTRVIDVGIDQEPLQVRLFETKRVQGVWVALSHCWGDVTKFTTESTNISQRISGTTISDLPKTFRDSVIVTRRLGYRYLWIDSLCILQDSQQDWQYESNQMQEYYSNAILTIATHVTTGDHESFLDISRPQVPFLQVPFISGDGDGSKYVYVQDINHGANPSGLDATPLSARGWTLQEDLLSPRMIHYTSKELVFECQRSRYYETDASPHGYNYVDERNFKRFFLRPESRVVKNPPISRSSETKEQYNEPLSRWYLVLDNFVMRRLTMESDRLVAIAGLAKEIQRQTGFSYQAGLWREDLLHGLLWRVNGSGHLPENYRAPSWSWASIDFGERLNYGPRLLGPDTWKERVILATVKDCNTQTVDGNPYSQVTAAQLRLHGFTLPLTNWRGMSPYVNVYSCPMKSHQAVNAKRSSVFLYSRPDSLDQLVCDFDISYWDNGSVEALSVSGESEDRQGSDEDEKDARVIWRPDQYHPGLILFQIEKRRPGLNDGEPDVVVLCLVLKPIDEKEASVKYLRVGVAEVPDVNGLAFDGWEDREVVII